jgi:four helix bundle protein
MFDALDVSLEMIRLLADPIRSIGRCDPDLARQLRRAAASVAMNLAEGRQRAGRDRAHLFRVAAGSAAETRTALEIARAWRYATEEEVAPAIAMCDRVQAMTWRLTHR